MAEKFYWGSKRMFWLSDALPNYNTIFAKFVYTVKNDSFSFKYSKKAGFHVE